MELCVVVLYLNSDGLTRIDIKSSDSKKLILQSQLMVLFTIHIEYF